MLESFDGEKAPGLCGGEFCMGISPMSADLVKSIVSATISSICEENSAIIFSVCEDNSAGASSICEDDSARILSLWEEDSALASGSSLLSGNRSGG
jgi:hypothetical protein